MAKKNENGKPKSDMGYLQVFETGKNKYKLTIRHGEKGDKKRESFRGTSKTDVERQATLFLRGQEKAKEEGKYYDKTLEEAMTHWLFNIKINEVKIQTFTRIESCARCHIIPEIGHIQMCNVDTEVIRQLIYSKLTVLGKLSIKKIKDTLNDFYKHCVEYKKMNNNPVYAMKMPAEDKYIDQKEIEIIQREDMEAFEKACVLKCNNGVYKYRNGASLILLMQTGMRSGELLALDWNDVDLEEGTINIWKTVIYKKLFDEDVTLTEEERILLESGRKAVYKIQLIPKTKSSIRKIYLNNKSMQALKILKELNNNFVVETRNGSFTAPNTYRNAFNKVLKRAMLSENGLHALRHTFTTLHRENGQTPEALAKNLGHKNTRMVNETYNQTQDKIMVGFKNIEI